ncbi:hypothetical protein CAEBREN_17493 [Caenorhabditis brenneri]|uniref:Uncharacterized protein n=1 Tax=Caenorhabditis brenneri TaxID=135651 RepID=G0P4U6_CAEBE|nr:hypothetical protein CAEBREN_17493 [Caenorhabditis brenneri]
MQASEAVQRQLKDDWDNREFEQVIADNIKSIANFLSSFGWFLFPFLLNNICFMFPVQSI